MSTEPLVDLSDSLDLAAMRRVNRAVAALRRHEMVVVLAEEGAVDGGADAVLALAVETVTPEDLRELANISGGAPAVTLTGRRTTILGHAAETATLAVTRGPLDMATALELADPEHRPSDDLLSRVELTPAGPAAAAALELARVARLLPAIVVVPLVGARPPRKRTDHRSWAERRDLLVVDAGEIGDYGTHAARTLRRVAEARVPLVAAERSRIVAFRPGDGGPEHLAIVIGDPPPDQPVLARLHSECFTGDLLGSLRCDCGDQLRGAIAEIERVGGGILLYLAQEGRGIGLVNKLRAYQLQDSGLDTVDANEVLGFEADERVYQPAAEMLRQLGFDRVRLMTNNPDKLRQLARCGVEVVERVPHVFASNGHNALYLRTKAERSGHMF